MRLAIPILLILFCALSCKQGHHSDVRLIRGKGGFFDVQAYFEAEEERLSSEISTAKKVVFYGSEKEEKVLDKIDFGQELETFISADINRPAWSDKYMVDTVMGANGATTVRIQSLDSALKTHKIIIDYALRDEVSKVFIENRNKGFLSDIRQLLTYEPNVGYSVESRQKLIFSKEQVFRIEVRLMD